MRNRGPKGGKEGYTGRKTRGGKKCTEARQRRRVKRWGQGGVDRSGTQQRSGAETGWSQRGAKRVEETAPRGASQDGDKRTETRQ